MSRNKKIAKKYQDSKNNKDVEKEEFAKKEGSTRASTNDPFWYSQDPALLRDAASIPWVAAAGTKQSLQTPLHRDTDRVEDGVTVHYRTRLNQSGVQIIKLAPTIGVAEDSSSPINIAMNNTYTKVRFQNSGHANYDAPDLMLYCLAMAEVYSAIQWLMRIYGIASLFTQRNRFVPEMLLKGEGVDYVSIRDNLASFRYGINLLIAKAASLCVPGDFTLFLRRAFVYSGVYTEGTSMKDQLYMYSPDGFYSYALNEDGSGMLRYDTLFGRLADESDYKYNELLDIVNDMLQKVIESEDCQIMSGDILKAYGENVLKLGTLNPDYTVVPTFDIAVLEQMKNAVVLPGYVNGNDITQDVTHAYLTCDPCIAVKLNSQTTDVTFLATAPLITTSTAEPGPEVTMENTRLLSVIKSFDEAEQVGDDWWRAIHLYTGTEMAVDLVYVAWPFNKEEPAVYYPGRAWYQNEQATLLVSICARPADESLFPTMAMMMNFKFAVGFWYASAHEDSETEVTQLYTYMTDVDNFTIQTADVIKNLHETAIMSEVNVPAINRLS